MKYNYQTLLKTWLKISTSKRDGKISHENCTEMDRQLHGFEAELRELTWKDDYPEYSSEQWQVLHSFIKEILGHA